MTASTSELVVLWDLFRDPSHIRRVYGMYLFVQVCRQAASISLSKLSKSSGVLITFLPQSALCLFAKTTRHLGFICHCLKDHFTTSREHYTRISVQISSGCSPKIHPVWLFCDFHFWTILGLWCVKSRVNQASTKVNFGRSWASLITIRVLCEDIHIVCTFLVLFHAFFSK